MKRSRPYGIIDLERLLGVAFIAWLQLVGIRTGGVLHHIIHAAPLALLLFVPPSPARHFTGFLAGFLWVFMLGVVTGMLHDALILGYLFSRPEVPYTWLAPVAALLAALWAAANAAALRERPRFYFVAASIGIGLIALFSWAYPYLSVAFQFPLQRTLEGQYAWILVLLLETFAVLALPSWCAFRLNPQLRLSASFLGWQLAYWVFFVAAMVTGLLPAFINR